MSEPSHTGEYWLERDGSRLRVVDVGQAEPALIFQHGLCGNQQQVAEVLPPNLPRRRITLECRGHGGSEPGKTAKFSLATFAEDVAAAAISRGVTRAAVGGISMGAAIALRLAVRRPELVQALILARPAWMTHAAPECMRPNAIVGHLLHHHAPNQARAIFHSMPLRAQLSLQAPDNLASLDSFFAREPVEITSALLRTISADGPGVTAEEVSSLSVPTLVIGHQQDLIHPVAHARTLAGIIPSARFVEITPKAQDKARYLAEFRSTLLAFLDTIAF